MNNNPTQKLDKEEDSRQNATSPLASMRARGDMGSHLRLKNTESGYTDPRFARLLWYLVGSSRGGLNRLKIMELISSNPSNANQIASHLMLDYKTVVHHLEVLTKNGLVVTENTGLYGAVYFLTPLMEKNYEFCKEIMEHGGQKVNLSQK